jgi:hypothetical protein
VYRTARNIAHEGRIVIPGPHVHGMHGTKRKFGLAFVVSLGNIDSISRVASLYTIQHYIHIVHIPPSLISGRSTIAVEVPSIHMIHDKPFNLIITKR